MCDVTSRCRAGRLGRPSGLFAPKRRMRPWRKHGCDVLNEQRNDLGNVSQRGFRSSVQTAIASRRRGNERSRPAQRTVVTQHATCTDGAACGRNHAASDGSASSPSLFSSGGSPVSRPRSSPPRSTCPERPSGVVRASCWSSTPSSPAMLPFNGDEDGRSVRSPQSVSRPKRA